MIYAQPALESKLTKRAYHVVTGSWHDTSAFGLTQEYCHYVGFGNSNAALIVGPIKIHQDKGGRVGNIPSPAGTR